MYKSYCIYIYISFHIILLFYVQYLIQTKWWPIYSCHPQRTINFFICLSLMDKRSVRSYSYDWFWLNYINDLLVSFWSVPTRLISFFSLALCSWYISMDSSYADILKYIKCFHNEINQSWFIKPQYFIYSCWWLNSQVQVVV